MICVKVMTSSLSFVLQLWELVAHLHLRAVFSLFLHTKHSRNGMNCVMAEKQHLTLGKNLWPLHINCVNSLLACHGLKTFGLKQQTLTFLAQE